MIAASTIDPMDFHEKITMIAEFRHINQATLRRKLTKKVASATVSNWFAGLYIPDLDVAFEIAQVLGVPIEYLADPSISKGKILRHLRGDDEMEPAQREIYNLLSIFTWEALLEIIKSTLLMRRTGEDIPLVGTNLGAHAKAETPSHLQGKPGKRDGRDGKKERNAKAAELKQRRTHLSARDIEARFGGDPKPMEDYVHTMESRMNALLDQAEPPSAKGLLVAVGMKEGRRVRVWCQAVEGDIPAPLARTIEAELAEVPSPDLKKGPAGFALEFAIFGRTPSSFPEFPDRWRDAAASTRSKQLVPPDDLFRLIWPD